MVSLFRGFRECFPTIFWIFRVGLPSDNSNKSTEKQLSLILLFHCTAPLSREETWIELRTNCTVACDKCDKFWSGAKKRLTNFSGIKICFPNILSFSLFGLLFNNSDKTTEKEVSYFFSLFFRTVPLFREEKLPGITYELYCSVRQVLERCKEKVTHFSGIKVGFPIFWVFLFLACHSIRVTKRPKRKFLNFFFYCFSGRCRFFEGENYLELRTNCTVACDKFWSGAKKGLTFFRGLRYVSPTIWVFLVLPCQPITAPKRPKKNLPQFARFLLRYRVFETKITWNFVRIVL